MIVEIMKIIILKFNFLNNYMDNIPNGGFPPLLYCETSENKKKSNLRLFAPTKIKNINNKEILNNNNKKQLIIFEEKKNKIEEIDSI